MFESTDYPVPTMLPEGDFFPELHCESPRQTLPVLAAMAVVVQEGLNERKLMLVRPVKREAA